MQRLVHNGLNYSLSSYVGVPNYLLKLKPGGIHAVAHTSISCGLSINIKPWNDEVRASEYKMRSLYINEKHRYDVVKGINSALEWFDLDKYPDLYYMSEENTLEFNIDYGKLHKKIFVETRKMKSAIVITPAVVDSGVDRLEGVRFYVNTRNVYVDLSIKDFEFLRDTIKNFNYQLEPILLMNIMQMGQETRL